MPAKKSPRAKTTSATVTAKKSPKKTTKVTKKQPSQLPALPQINFSQINWKNLKQKKYYPYYGVVVLLIILALVLPHLVVAFVDGKPIFAWDYYSQLDQKYGSGVKDQMITEQLIMDEAGKRGVSVSDADINSQVKKYEDQASGSANLNQMLVAQGLTQDEFRKQIKLQELIQKMFSSEASVSAKDIDDYIAQNKDQFQGDITDATKQSVADQLKQQKLVSAFQAWLQGAQSSNRVKRL